MHRSMTCFKAENMRESVEKVWSILIITGTDFFTRLHESWAPEIEAACWSVAITLMSKAIIQEEKDLAPVNLESDPRS